MSGFGNCFIRSLSFVLALMLAALLFIAGPSLAQLPEKDLRAGQLIDSDHFELRFRHVDTREGWEARKKEIREKFLVYSGLWPPPVKCALHPKVFDEKRGDGFRVDKVYFESLPGYLVTGNLYRPAEGNGPFPAVVCPHGHWKYGRLTNGESGSIPARCIDMARMGFVVLSIDMVGFNDNFQLPHDPNKSRQQLKADVPVPYEPRLFRGDFDFPRARLYGLSLGGLHAWNAIRAVDFLVSLPEVDSNRIAATGASGGASQTLFLMAADPRIKAAAPVNIIGAAKHPGCRCENMPGMWVDLSTMEIAASFAPKPLILLSATEDPWTNSFPTRELPIIKKYYSLYGAEDMVRNKHIKGGHNYNAQSREAVYEWFATHLESPVPAIKNPPVIAPEMKQLGDLRVFPDHMLPEQAKSGQAIIRDWIRASEKMFQANLPRTAAELEKFAGEFGSRLASVLQLERPRADEILSRKTSGRLLEGLSHEKLVLGRKGRGDRVSIEVLSGDKAPKGTLVLVRPEQCGGLLTPEMKNLAGNGYRVLRVGGYASGELSIAQKDWDSFSWPEAYNRSNQLNAVQDILTALCFVKKTWPGEPVILAGTGSCGLGAAFAGAVFGEAQKVVIDLDGTDPGYDGELLRLLPVGSIRRVGDFRTAAILLMRQPLSLLNAASTFDGEWYAKQAAKLGLAKNLELRLQERPDLVKGLL